MTMARDYKGTIWFYLVSPMDARFGATNTVVVVSMIPWVMVALFHLLSYTIQGVRAVKSHNNFINKVCNKAIENALICKGG